MSTVNNIVQKSDRNHVVEYTLVILLVTAMLISDWVLGPFAVSELVMMGILALTLLREPQLLLKLRVKWLGFIIIYMTLHIGVNAYINEAFNLRLGIYSFIKVLFFSVFINIIYDYIRKNGMELKLLKVLNIGGLIALLIGLYITIAIATNFELPYEFLWRFTRTSSFTYEFKGNSDIIRTRSLFSEPAHFGYFLNILLGMNFFGVIKEKFSVYYSAIFIIGILLSLSYASIGVMVILVSTKLILLWKEAKSRNAFQNKMSFIVLVFLIVITIFIFRDFLYTTIIERTMGILNGTDDSAYNRLISSWTHINSDYLLFGNGIAHSPPIQNIYAYFLTDLGVIGFAAITYATYKLLTLNFGMGLLFILLNFQKGGYLSPIFWLYILVMLVYIAYRNQRISIEEK